MLLVIDNALLTRRNQCQAPVASSAPQSAASKYSHRHECGVKSTAKANEEAAHDEAFDATEEMRRAHQRGAQNGDRVVQ